MDAIAQGGEQHARLETKLAAGGGDRTAVRPAFHEAIEARSQSSDFLAIDARHQCGLTVIGFDHLRIEQLVLKCEMRAQ